MKFAPVGPLLSETFTTRSYPLTRLALSRTWIFTHLRRKMDIRNLTLYVTGQNNIEKGRFYMLWRDGNFIVIQAEPSCRPGITYDPAMPFSHYLAEYRAFNYLQEVTRLVDGLFWEGIYNGQEVDLYIGWEDVWGAYITFESRGQKLMHSLGLGHYTFELLAHVSKNGMIIGLMMEAYVGHTGGITLADRPAVFEAVADIQRHGVLLRFQRNDIFITKQGVRFASMSSATLYRDQDALAEAAESVHWKTLADMFDNIDNDPFGGQLSSSRSMPSTSYVIPRLPSPGRPVSFTAEEAFIRWAFSFMTSDEPCRSNFTALAKLVPRICGPTSRSHFLESQLNYADASLRPTYIKTLAPCTGK
ncbi:hypothetical protein BU15DRAFT_62386 [Melanogaster broomeanus]|nr:hypothetical protein BU15DRAFT_62386 [Melanogaster broomeanus]